MRRPKLHTFAFKTNIYSYILTHPYVTQLARSYCKCRTLRATGKSSAGYFWTETESEMGKESLEHCPHFRLRQLPAALPKGPLHFLRPREMALFLSESIPPPLLCISFTIFYSAFVPPRTLRLDLSPPVTHEEQDGTG